MNDKKDFLNGICGTPLKGCSTKPILIKSKLITSSMRKKAGNIPFGCGPRLLNLSDSSRFKSCLALVPIDIFSQNFTDVFYDSTRHIDVTRKFFQIIDFLHPLQDRINFVNNKLKDISIDLAPEAKVVEHLSKYFSKVSFYEFPFLKKDVQDLPFSEPKEKTGYMLKAEKDVANWNKLIQFLELHSEEIDDNYIALLIKHLGGTTYELGEHNHKSIYIDRNCERISIDSLETDLFLFDGHFFLNEEHGNCYISCNDNKNLYEYKYFFDNIGEVKFSELSDLDKVCTLISLSFGNKMAVAKSGQSGTIEDKTKVHNKIYDKIKQEKINQLFNQKNISFKDANLYKLEDVSENNVKILASEILNYFNNPSNAEKIKDDLITGTFLYNVEIFKIIKYYNISISNDIPEFKYLDSFVPTEFKYLDSFVPKYNLQYNDFLKIFGANDICALELRNKYFLYGKNYLSNTNINGLSGYNTTMYVMLYPYLKYSDAPSRYARINTSDASYNKCALEIHSYFGQKDNCFKRKKRFLLDFIKSNDIMYPVKYVNRINSSKQNKFYDENLINLTENINEIQNQYFNYFFNKN